MSEELKIRARRVRHDSGIVRHGRQKSRGPVRTVLGFIGAALVVVLVSGAAVASIAAWDIARSVQPGVALANEGSIPQISEIEGGVNLLLVGSDSRAGTDPNVFDVDPGSVLNDVNMILHISQDHKSATVVSIPRDMVVHFPDCPDGGGGWTGPINATLNEGGLACVVLTVEALTGLSIPFAAEIQFNGVIEMANAIGGVDVCVADRIEDDYTQTYLDPGMHTLSGLAALQFLRTRHGVGDGSDLGRISNQQVFLSSLVRKLKSAETLTNPIALYGLAKAAVSNMTLSNSLNNVDTMVSIAMAMKDIPLDSIVFVQYPGTTGGVGVYSGKVQPNVAAAEALFGAILADQPVGLSGTTGQGSVVDPNAPVVAAPEPAAGTDASTNSATGTPDPAPVAAPVTVLPDSVLGQTAGTYTCSKGRTLNYQ
ncbi:MAG: LCP family protein [Actinomycetales bacterium]|nr:LCP family protein [Actinomycetales bacterium]